MQQWDADAALNELLARYYAGEAGLWQRIQAAVDEELRRRGLPPAPRHIRFRRLPAGGYRVIVEDADDYAAPL
ncbi:MAG: hypothetical protein DIU80_019305 [Chloroflexota bacterium]|nr:MAG: hypothetical protein DIU80_16640 [Chloroflexota bacterium]